MELFFVLSGFLIGGILLKASGTDESAIGWIPHFWMRRWLRTVPNYLLFIGINVLLLSAGIRLTGWPNNLGAYIFFLQNLAWPHPHFYGEAWSLATEEVFYLTVPLLIGLAMLFGLRRARAVVWVALLIFAVSLIARLVYVSEMQPTWDEGVRKIVVFRLDALMMGVLCAWMYQHAAWRGSLRKCAPYLIILLVLPISTGFIANSSLDQSMFARVWLFPATSLACSCLLIAGLDLHINRYVASVANTIARLSYSAYLANLPVRALIQHYGGSGGGLVADISRWMLFIGGTFLIAWFVYQFFERPVLAFRDRNFACQRTALTLTAARSI